MKFKTTVLISCIFFSLFACGKSETQSSVSAGLKIFATEEMHVSDFANDPTLAGNNAIEKADNFCNTSVSKPSDATYKALIVDGNLRDAVTLTNWVLLPNTTYYRAYDDIVVDTTSSSSIFTAYWRDMVNSVDDCSGPDCFVWTGIEDAATFATYNHNCSGWSGVGDYGMWGYSSSATSEAFSGGVNGSCNGTGIKAKIYCVEQP